MPHKCARCGKIYDDNSKELIEGCSCGSRVFLYLKEKPGLTEEETIKELKERGIQESDIEWLDREFGDKLAKGVIHLDVENLIRLGEGKFKLDIASLMSGKPIVVRAKEGVYYIDIPYAMKPRKK
ncbi:MAG TPA: hypothetical protein ENF58_02785 [Candidatus Altiarchaeales archaeon]|nr:hypothetical protein [Candidatus Altiarchaeales archaeon]